MRTLKFFVTILCATVLLTSGQVFGQSKKDKTDIMTPVKGDNFKEMAEKLTKEGWKTSGYSIEEQLVSTAKLKGEMNHSTHDALYLWVTETTTAADLASAKEANYISSVNNLTYQIAMPFMSQCRMLLLKKGAEDKIDFMEKIIRQITPMVLQNQLHKTMEIYLEKDKTFTMQSVYMLNTEKFYDVLMEECINQTKAEDGNEILAEVFRETKKRMDKRTLW